jgi:hypothetical protein
LEELAGEVLLVSTNDGYANQLVPVIVQSLSLTPLSPPPPTDRKTLRLLDKTNKRGKTPLNIWDSYQGCLD